LLSHQRGKKESGDSFVGLLHFSKHTEGGGATPAFSGQLVYLKFTWGSASLPLSGGDFHMTATVTSFPHSKVAGQGLPLLSSLAGLFIYRSCEGMSPPWSSGCPALCYVSFFFFLLFVYYSVWFFFFFFPGRRLVCPGGYADLSQGVLCTTYLLTWWSPKQVRSWHLVVQVSSWFLCLTWCRDAMHGLGVWRCQSFASSWWFFLIGVSPASFQEFTLGSTLSASSL
jgi:hypothetical protein